MALMPGAEHRLLPESATQGRIRPIGVIDHSIVGSAEGAYGYFLNSTSLESTFLLKKSGHIIQIMDTEVQADANGEGNAFYVNGERCGYGSVETEDNGDPDNDPWTDAQVESLVKIHLFYSRQHGVPAQAILTHTMPGFGWHTMFGAPGPWTKSRGKTCPGIIRREQWRYDVLPRTIAAIYGTDPTGDDFMAGLTEDEQQAMFASVRATELRVLSLQQIVLGAGRTAANPNGAASGTLLGRIRDGVAQDTGILKAIARHLKVPLK